MMVGSKQSNQIVILLSKCKLYEKSKYKMEHSVTCIMIFAINNQ